jgi:hypothetical protein
MKWRVKDVPIIAKVNSLGHLTYDVNGETWKIRGIDLRALPKDSLQYSNSDGVKYSINFEDSLSDYINLIEVDADEVES